MECDGLFARVDAAVSDDRRYRPRSVSIDDDIGGVVDDFVRRNGVGMDDDVTRRRLPVKFVEVARVVGRGTRSDVGGDVAELRLRQEHVRACKRPFEVRNPVVAGLATLTDLAGAFFLLAGLSVLPPVRLAVERRLDRPVGPRLAFGGAGVLFVVGAAVLAYL